MTVKELIAKLSGLNSDLEIVVRINKYYTFRPAHLVETGKFYAQSGVFDADYESTPNAVAIRD
jgi:hypothetical protein